MAECMLIDVIYLLSRWAIDEKEKEGATPVANGAKQIHRRAPACSGVPA
jgi:hypothetical protein